MTEEASNTVWRPSESECESTTGHGWISGKGFIETCCKCGATRYRTDTP